MHDYTGWIIRYRIKKAVAIVLIAPLCLILLPFVMLGDALGWLFRQLYYPHY